MRGGPVRAQRGRDRKTRRPSPTTQRDSRQTSLAYRRRRHRRRLVRWCSGRWDLQPNREQSPRGCGQRSRAAKRRLLSDQPTPDVLCSGRLRPATLRRGLQRNHDHRHRGGPSQATSGSGGLCQLRASLSTTHTLINRSTASRTSRSRPQHWPRTGAPGKKEIEQFFASWFPKRIVKWARSSALTNLHYRHSV